MGMFIPDLVGSIQDVLHDIGELGGGVEIIIDQGAIDGVLKTLDTGHKELKGSRFPDLNVPLSSFGTTGPAQQLGDHHGMAHVVITDTIQGILVDLIAFRTALQHAEQLLHSVDSDAASEIDKKREAVEVITRGSRSAEANRRNRESRNNNLPGGRRGA